MKFKFLENERRAVLGPILQTNFKVIHNASKKKLNSIESTRCNVHFSSREKPRGHMDS